MAIITLFNGLYCQEDDVIRELLATGRFQIVEDTEIVADAARLSGTGAEKIMRAFSAKTSIFNKFNHEKETSVAYLKLATAGRLSDEKLIVHGFAALLIPRDVQHALRVCLIAELKHRIDIAAQAGIAEKEAVKQIRRHDEDRAAWAQLLFNNPDPWSAALYDLVLPTDKKPPETAAAAIIENAAKPPLQPTAESRQAVADFLLAAEVEVALVREGHHVEVNAREGELTLTVNKPVLMFNRLEEELEEIALKVAGVQSVKTIAGQHFHQPQIYRKHDFRMPSKVLLVDDEREFVETLSERLQIRDMGAAVTYNGRSALEMIDDDEPEVVIIDLKMPGIDGIEMLKRVKSTRPEIEVIVLTGHGSEADRQLCMQLGAFAYLQKPVDIDELSVILKEAHEKIRQAKTSGQ